MRIDAATSTGIARIGAATRTPATLEIAPSTRLATGRAPRKATDQSAMIRPRWSSVTPSWSRVVAAGLVDELSLHVAPVLLGGGARLFDGVGPGVVLEQVRTVDAPQVTHLTYRTVR